MEIKKRQIKLKTLSRNPLEEKIRLKQEVVKTNRPLKRAYMRRPEDVKHPDENGV